MKLDLGSGRVKKEGYTSVDVYPFRYLDVQHDIEEKLPFDDASADEIYCSHVLEHCSMQAVPNMLRDWHRVLVDDGIVKIIVPEIEVCMRNFLDAPESKKWGNVIEYIVGCQHHQVGQQNHKSAYTPTRITELLRTAGFKVNNLEIINNKVNDCIHLTASKQ